MGVSDGHVRRRAEISNTGAGATDVRYETAITSKDMIVKGNAVSPRGMLNLVIVTESSCICVKTE